MAMITTLPVRLLLFVAFVVGTAIGARAQLYCNGEPITEGAKYVLLAINSDLIITGNRIEAYIDHGQVGKLAAEFRVTSADGSTLQWRSPAHLLTWMDNQGWEYQGPQTFGHGPTLLFRRKD